MGRPIASRSGLTLTELIILTAIFAPVLLIIVFFLGSVRPLTREIPCAARLSGIARALSLYQNEFNDRNPVRWSPGAPGSFGMGLYNEPGEMTFTRWADPCFTDWQTQPTVGGSLYLLVRTQNLSPLVFLCPASRTDEADGGLALAQELCAAQGWPQPRDWSDLNDFYSMRNLSYSYNDPWAFPSGAYSAPGLAIMADKSCAYDTPTGELDPSAGLGPKDEGRDSLSRNHVPHNGGINILLAESRVIRSETAVVGIEQDNIYTRWPDGPDTESQRRRLGRWDRGHAAHENDAYLGN